jgi:hypothetical protein
MVSLEAGRPVAVNCELAKRTARVGPHPLYRSDFAGALSTSVSHRAGLGAAGLAATLPYGRCLPRNVSDDLRAQVWFWLRIQPVDATISLYISAGVLKSRVFLGRSLSFLATAFSWACE